MDAVLDAISLSISDPKVALLVLGGYVYWDHLWACCGVSSLKLGSGLCFDRRTV